MFKGTLILLMFFSYNLLSQTETLIQDKITSSGYGAPVIKFTKFKDFAVLAGGRGAWIINNHFTFGGGGYGLANKIKANKDYGSIFGFQLADKPDLSFGYGGVEFGYFDNPQKLVHFYFLCFIGAGSVHYKKPENWTFILGSNLGRIEWNDQQESFFIMEPEIQLMINVTKFFKLGLGFSYRITSKINFDGLNYSDISFPAGVISFNFGGF